MTSSSSIKPMNWADYEQGRLPRQGSAASLGSRIHFDKSASGATSDRLDVSHSNDRNGDAEDRLRKRRSNFFCHHCLAIRILSFEKGLI